MNRINLICLGVSDSSKSLKFYKSIGFECSEKNENPPIVFFNNSGSKLELFPFNELAKDINLDIVRTVSKDTFNGITLAINMKSKQEVDDLMKLVQSMRNKKKSYPHRIRLLFAFQIQLRWRFKSHNLIKNLEQTP